MKKLSSVVVVARSCFKNVILRLAEGSCLGFFCLLLVTSPGFAQALFPAGVESKAAGMESAQVVRSAPSLQYNPANLSMSGENEAYLELGYTQVILAYEHPDFDQVKVKVRTPMGSVGYVGYLLTPKVRWGFYISPERRGSQDVPGLPRNIGGEYLALKVTVEDEVTLYGLGASYQVLPYFSLGVSWIHLREKRRIEANQIGNNEMLVKFDGYNSFNRPVFGTRAKFGRFSQTLSYMPPLEKTYKGRQKGALDEGFTDPKPVDYRPAIYRLGLGYADPNYFANLSVNHLRASAGRNRQREGLTSSVKRADLHDVTEFGLQIGHRFNNQFKASLAYAYLPSRWGEGKSSDDPQEQTIGVDFGRADAIDRQVFAAGFGYRPTDNCLLDFALMRSFGEREIGASGDHPGFYQSEVVVFAGAMTAEF